MYNFTIQSILTTLGTSYSVITTSKVVRGVVRQTSKSVSATSKVSEVCWHPFQWWSEAWSDPLIWSSTPWNLKFSPTSKTIFIRTTKSMYFTAKYEYIAFFHPYRWLTPIYFTSKVNVILLYFKTRVLKYITFTLKYITWRWRGKTDVLMYNM